ncbi:hypothetical protein SAMN02745823_03038 [Sporobacter termitidis DSM 10068]|uniref:Uncharacterized protein n=1 Tax=Sporobacter termitidis DSM 10068 TaxID=1123282 RepID=A0A1M5Z0A2_9FIRM|nr:hypothetical protein [Sporobacter termitidis]SHI17697.1 hypothetical protein SAMN02745823_03038 [Sporobacter termitidis DSM 10068]
MEQSTVQTNTTQQNTAVQQPAPIDGQAAAVAAAVPMDLPVYTEDPGPQPGSGIPGEFEFHSGHRITELSENVFVFGIIISLIIGFIIWSRRADLTGFLEGIAATVAGYFLSKVLRVCLNGYAQLINNAAEQTRILKRMEQERAAQLLKEAQAEMAQAAAAAAQEQVAQESTASVETTEVFEAPDASDAPGTPEEDNGEDAPAEDNEELNKKAAIALVEESLSDTVKAKVFDAYNPGSRRRNPFAPTQEAVETDRHNRIAVFSARYGGEVKCPICNRRQSSNDNVCQLCGCRFIFVDNTKKGRKASRQ